MGRVSEWVPHGRLQRSQPRVGPAKGGGMAKRPLREYQRLSSEDQRTFDRWLKANAIVGAILFIGMLAMAWMGNSVGRTDAAMAIPSKSSNVAGSNAVLRK